MADLKVLVTSGDDSKLPGDVQAELTTQRAIHTRPTYIDLRYCRIIPGLTPGIIYDKPTIKKGRYFYLQMFVAYSEILGDLEADFVAEFYAQNVATCQSVKDYCASVEGKLKCDTTWIRITAPVYAAHEGIFVLSGSFHLPKSELFDFCCFKVCFAVFDDKCGRPHCYVYNDDSRLMQITETASDIANLDGE